MDILELAREGRIKRLLLVKNKLYYPGAVCHICQKATGEEFLFLDKDDYVKMVRLIQENVDEFQYRLLSYVLMPTHLHLLLKLVKTNLKSAMHSLFTRYAIYFNSRYERRGHLFQGPYSLSLCFSDAYLLAVSLYIHLNPVRANLAEEPWDYLWSSCSYYLSSSKRKSFLERNFILEILDRQLSASQRIYRELLEEGKKIDDLQEEEIISKQIESFRMRMMKLLGRPRSKLFQLPEDKFWNRNFKYLREKKRLKEVNLLVRKMQLQGYTMKEIGEKLGLSRPTLYRLITRAAILSKSETKQEKP